MGRLRIFLLVLPLVIGVAGAANAGTPKPVAKAAASAPDGEDRVRARAEFKAGMKHYNLSEYAEALERFKDAYRAYPEPLILYNIGQCYRQLGQKREGLKAFRNYLNNSSSMHDAVEQIVAQLDKQIRDEEEAARQEKLAKEAAEQKRLEAESAAKPAAVAPTIVAAPPEKKPIYKKGWFWATVGGFVLVAGVGLGVGLGLSLSKTKYPSTSAGGGTFNF